jgi:hypothetical protein
MAVIMMPADNRWGEFGQALGGYLGQQNAQRRQEKQTQELIGLAEQAYGKLNAVNEANSNLGTLKELQKYGGQITDARKRYNEAEANGTLTEELKKEITADATAARQRAKELGADWGDADTSDEDLLGRISNTKKTHVLNANESLSKAGFSTGLLPEGDFDYEKALPMVTNSAEQASKQYGDAQTVNLGIVKKIATGKYSPHAIAKAAPLINLYMGQQVDAQTRDLGMKLINEQDPLKQYTLALNTPGGIDLYNKITRLGRYR